MCLLLCRYGRPLKAVVITDSGIVNQDGSITSSAAGAAANAEAGKSALMRAMAQSAGAMEEDF